MQANGFINRVQKKVPEDFFGASPKTLSAHATSSIISLVLLSKSE